MFTYIELELVSRTNTTPNNCDFEESINFFTCIDLKQIKPPFGFNETLVPHDAEEGAMQNISHS